MCREVNEIKYVSLIYIGVKATKCFLCVCVCVFLFVFFLFCFFCLFFAGLRMVQLDAHPTCGQEVAGSTPAGSATFFRGDLS